MLPGVFQAQKKDGTIYFRSSFTFKNKHISLGSYPNELQASRAYREACLIMSDCSYTPDSDFHSFNLYFSKIISLLNFRDHGIYMKSPIYLRKHYFQYFLSPHLDYKFDQDDLFYYSNKSIIKRNGHLCVSDYGMQVSILSRYGIKPYGIKDRDYVFINNDETDLRRSNIQIINPYTGVTILYSKTGQPQYRAFIHIRGNHQLGIYETEETAAIAYNKAVDLLKNYGINKNYNINFIDTISSKDYAAIYTTIKLPDKFLSYLANQFTD